MFSLAAKKIGDQDEAYDLLQDMFIELWNKRATFSISNPLGNYLKNRLWFKLSGHFRAKGFKEKHFKNFSDFLQLQQQTTPYLNEMELKEMQYEAIMEVINRTIEQMPAKMREVFVLSRSKAYSIAEIAEELNISPKTVKNQLNSALNRIRRATSDPSLSTLELFILIGLTIK